MQSLFKPKTLQITAITVFMAAAAWYAMAFHPAPSASAHVTRLNLISHGMTVGQGRIIRASVLRDGKACMELRLIIETKVDLLFFKYAFKMDEAWITDPSGLIAYQWDSLENGRHKTITGKLRDGVFHFEIMEEGQKRSWTTPRAAFDLVSVNPPGQALSAGEEKHFSVLDPTTCTITERTYRGTGKEMLTVGNRQIMCNTVAIEYPGTQIRRWFIADEFGPLVLREDSHQKRGSYSRRAVSTELEQRVAD